MTCVTMHFLMDLVAFLVCHVQVTRAGEDAQRELIEAGSPIASTLRKVFYGGPRTQ